jgi:hypothetical protein
MTDEDIKRAELDMIENIVRSWLASLAGHMTVAPEEFNVVEIYLNAVTNFTGMLLGPLPDEKRKKLLHRLVLHITESVTQQAADYKRFKEGQGDD